MARTESDIRVRIALGEWLIRSIENDPDPRRDAAIATLREQIATLQGELEAAQRKIAQVAPERPAGPHDVVIGMKTLSMRGTVGGQDGSR